MSTIILTHISCVNKLLLTADLPSRGPVEEFNSATKDDTHHAPHISVGMITNKILKLLTFTAALCALCMDYVPDSSIVSDPINRAGCRAEVVATLSTENSTDFSDILSDFLDREKKRHEGLIFLPVSFSQAYQKRLCRAPGGAQ